MTRRRRRVAAVLAATLVATAAAFLPPPLAQDPGYHEFADGRAALGIPNFADVASNLPFALIGALALRFVCRRRHGGAPRPSPIPGSGGPMPCSSPPSF